jgi:hypothetical protein
MRTFSRVKTSSVRALRLAYGRGKLPLVDRVVKRGTG